MTNYDMKWTFMTMYDNVWHCMTMCDIVWQCMALYDIVWQCVSNVWQEWMTGHSMQRLRVPGSVAHWSDVDTGVFPLSILLALFFSSSFLLLVFPDIESFSNHILLALALCAFSGSFSVNIFTDYSFGDSQAIPVEFWLLFIKVCLESRQVEIKSRQY